MESKITLCWKHNVPTAEVQAAVKQVATDLGTDYGAQTTWRGDVGSFVCTSSSAKGVTGSLAIEPGVVLMVVELPFILRPFANRIREGICARLKERLGGGLC
jgi:hypothetical protein